MTPIATCRSPSLGLAEDVSDMESDGGEIPSKAIEDTKAPEEQVNGELKERVEEETEEKEDDEGESNAEEGM
jgi:hypothetical protein